MNRTTKQLLIDAPDVVIPQEKIKRKDAFALNAKNEPDIGNFKDDCFKTPTGEYVRLNDDDIERELDEIKLQIQLSMLRRINTIKSILVFFAFLAVIGIIIAIISLFNPIFLAM